MEATIAELQTQLADRIVPVKDREPIAKLKMNANQMELTAKMDSLSNDGTMSGSEVEIYACTSNACKQMTKPGLYSWWQS